MATVEDFGVTESKSQILSGESTAILAGRSHRLIPLAVFALSVLVTVVFWKLLPNSFRLNEGTDYVAYYEPLARGVLAGQGLSWGPENPATRCPPGYPLILAGVFRLSAWLGIPDDFGLSAFTAIAMGVVSVLVFLLARSIWGMRAALAASLLWMTYPFALWLTKQAGADVPFILVFYAGLLLLWHALMRRTSAWHLYFACGALFGIAMLIRPIAIGISLVLAPVVWFTRRELSRRTRYLLITMLLLGNLVAVLPWEGLVYARTGKVILLSNNGIMSIQDGLVYAVDLKGYREPNTVSPDVAEVMKDFSARFEGVDSFGALASVVAREFAAHPIAMAKLFLLKIARSWFGTDSMRKEFPILIIQALYLGPVLWSIRTVWRRGGIQRDFAISVLLIVFYFWGMTFLVLSSLRYMVPAVGLLFVLVAGSYPLKLGSEPKSASG